MLFVSYFKVIFIICFLHFQHSKHYKINRLIILKKNFFKKSSNLITRDSFFQLFTSSL